MNADFIGQMTSLRDLAAAIAPGLPNIRSLILRRRETVPGDSFPSTTFLSIFPLPYISTASPQLAAAYQSAGITIEVDDLRVSGVSKEYSREQLVGTGVAYWVDAQLSSDGRSLIGGFECDFVGITSETLTWNLILRRKPDDR